MNSYQEEINKLFLDPGFRNWALQSDVRDYREWENTIKSDERIASIAREAKRIIIEIELSESHISQDDLQSYDRLRRKMKAAGDETPHVISYRQQTSVPGVVRWYRIAAVIIFFMVFAGILYVTHQGHIIQGQPDPVLVHKQTQNGQQLTITLPDGSRVKLNSNSSISYAKEFFANRTVELKGEAFFSVARDESHPFIVKAGAFHARVLGTSFNVNAYENGHGKVSVSEGKVLVLATDNMETIAQTIIEKRQAVEIVESELKPSPFNEDELLWKDGILVFADESIHTVSQKIERWFNVRVVVENEEAIAGEFSGKYSNESLEEILKGMGYALNFSFKMEGNEVLIKGNN